ncbi:Chondroitinase-AC [Dactylellina cionopaga]|nr:Chondroitinase-AC [Dactylellina cionopaga]
MVVKTAVTDAAAAPQLMLPTHFQRLRQRWRATVTGNHMLVASDDVYFALSKLSGTAEQYISRIRTSRLHIWDDLSPIHLSVNFRKSYERLRTIAQSYSIPGSIHYHDLNVQETIIQSLDFISSEIYNSSVVQAKGENWWNFRIGAPLALVDIAMLLYDDLTPRRRHDYGATIIKNIGNINERSLKGANRADICLALIGAGIITNDEAEVARGRWGLSDKEFNRENSVFRLVQGGEGLYEGGSYISHEIFPYSGGYGVQHYYSLSKAVNVLSKSPYQVSRTELLVTFAAVDSTFVPVLWRGMMMAHIRGRDIARKSEPDALWGNLFLQSLLYFADSDMVPRKYRIRFKSLARGIWEAAPLPDMFGLNITQAFGIQRVLQERVLAAPPPIGTFATPMSDRVMHHRTDWASALAMSSSRIGRYESLNNENLQPWYQGDGFLYIYTDKDPLHFSNDYWPTMDPYHSPGVTNGQNPQDPHGSNSTGYKFTAYRDWAGGLDWRGAHGVAGLDALSNDRGSSAKKSWFFLLNSIIALGAGCAGFSGTEVHTTIESRNLPLVGSNFSINGEYQTTTPGWIQPWEETREGVDWAYLDSFGGYVFLDKEPVTFKHEKRSGRWTDINKYPDYLGFSDSITREYITIYRNHGIDPKDGHYAYALLPSASVNNTLDFATSPPINITHNTSKLQAIQFNNTVMANFWSGGTIDYLTAVTPCSVTWGYSGVVDKYLTISISDPTQKATRLVLFLDDPDIGGVVEKDDSIILRWSRAGETGSVIITVNVEETHGKTHRLSFERISWRGSLKDLPWKPPTKDTTTILTTTSSGIGHKPRPTHISNDTTTATDQSVSSGSVKPTSHDIKSSSAAKTTNSSAKSKPVKPTIKPSLANRPSTSKVIPKPSSHAKAKAKAKAKAHQRLG